MSLKAHSYSTSGIVLLASALLFLPATGGLAYGQAENATIASPKTDVSPTAATPPLAPTVIEVEAEVEVEVEEVIVESADSAQEVPQTVVTPIENTRPGNRQLQAFRNAIENAESLDGAYASPLPEQLLSLGLALQGEDRHTDAIAIFKRGSHLARINNGLYSAAQIPFLEREISSHLTLGEFTEADEGQARLFRVQQRSLSDSDNLVEALLAQGRWQRRAYKLGLGGEEMAFGRLLQMWDFNRMALTTVIDREGEKSLNLIPPLNAMLQAQYLISGHNDRSKSATFDFNSNLTSRQTHSRFNSYLAKSYDMGRSIIRAIYDVQSTHHGQLSVQAIESRIMLADWMLWHGVRDPALEAYTIAVGELAELDDAQLQTQRLLGVPVPLPDVDGVRPLLPEVSADKGNILVEFAVSAGGRVKEAVRLESDDKAELGDPVPGRANRLLRALRKTKFRPRFVDGVPTPTENIVKAYAITN